MRKKETKFGRDLFGFRNDINNFADSLFTKSGRTTLDDSPLKLLKETLILKSKEIPVH